MGKTPYLFRRNNVFYFRCRVPVCHQNSFDAREIVHSLRTENREDAARQALKIAANFKQLLHDLKTGKAGKVSRADLLGVPSNSEIKNTQQIEKQPLQAVAVSVPTQRPVFIQETPQAPLLSVVVDDFLSRYDKSNKTMLSKLVSFMPIFIELVGDRSVNQILQADLNRFFDDVQKLPVRRDSEKFKGLSIRQMIAANNGPCISQKTYYGTYRCCIGIFTQWAFVNYADQCFPLLSVQGADYRGERGNGINKQRAMKPEELQKLFINPKMKKYAANPETVHYFWLPLIGLYTGARINEVCQLNPFEDIKQDSATGIHYFHFTDESESIESVDKSIKTNSSRRIVPIHSKLIEAGFLDYVEKVKSSGHKILFPAWQPRNGKASANASKWFTRYLESIGLRDEAQGARLSGFHSFRHTFITHAMQNKIQGVFAITGHESEVVDGFGKISDVARGYWTRGLTDNIQELKEVVERFDFGVTL